MKAILRDLRTGLYFHGGAAWTHIVEDALVYRNIEAALEAGSSSNISSLELNVLFFDDPRYTVRLALAEFFFRRPDHPAFPLPPVTLQYVSSQIPMLNLGFLVTLPSECE